MSQSLDKGECPVCASERITIVQAATGRHGFCEVCFHGYRIDIPAYSYQANTMCSLGSDAARLASQCAFVAPFVAPGAAVLELGCATGELAQVLRQNLPIARYDAVELSSAGETAKTRVDTVHPQTLPNLLKQGIVAPASYDTVVMSHVLEHIEDIATEVAAIAEVLAEGGVAFIEVPQGSGNVALPLDDNIAHLHFFSVGSLSRLLARFGLDVIGLQTNARLDARCADSLRVAARRFRAPVLADLDLGQSPLLPTEPMVVWGAGSLASEILANHLAADRIAYFIDRNPAKHGTTLLGHPVHAPEVLIGAAPATILVNSIDFAPAIEADINALLPGHSHKLIRIGDVLDHFRNKKRHAGG